MKSMNTYCAELVFSEALPDGLHSLEQPVAHFQPTLLHIRVSESGISTA